MKIELGCYYFPNYHTGDSRNDAFHGAGWSEWEPLRNSIPRFPGHQQPRIPLWGEEDEKSPQVMARKIDAASDAGIGVFIFDWYYYNDGPFLERALEEGFLNAPNRGKMKFCTMWANHNWYDIHPAPLTDRQLLYPGVFTRETFEKVAQIHIRNYFSRPEYYTLDGCPYFSIYELALFVQSFGSVAETRRAMEDFRAEVKAAGFPGVHLNAIVWGAPILPGESTPKNPTELAAELGFDSAASYVWVHHASLPQPQTPYDYLRQRYFDFWETQIRTSPLEYFPNISVGWDSTPRTRPDEVCTFKGNYPYGPMVIGNTPQEFETSLRMVKKRLEELNPRHPFATINSWNEWTEGSYLEPDTLYKSAYLDAVKAVFKG